MPFSFKLVLEDGTPAEPPMLATAVPNWRPGDRVYVSPKRVYRVVAVKEGVLVVERE